MIGTITIDLSWGKIKSALFFVSVEESLSFVLRDKSRGFNLFLYLFRWTASKITGLETLVIDFLKSPLNFFPGWLPR